jgi:sialate O-acetylesterase
MTIEKNKAIISFDHSDGLHSLNGDPACFEIAGQDDVFYPAKARIKDGKVFVQSDKVRSPVKVRFAWTNIATPNLFNGANLPASSFISE